MSEEHVLAILDKHIRFWQKSGAPLLGKVPTRQWQKRPFPLKDGRTLTEPQRIRASDLDPQLLLGEQGVSPQETCTGDFINPIGSLYPEAWMEALIGCPIHASAYGCVAKPTEALTLDNALESPWMRVMEELLERAERLAEGKLPVRQWHLRGTVDMLAACLGEERLCLTIYDNPKQIANLGRRFAELIVAVVRQGLRSRRRWHGGYVSGRKVFIPGEHIDYQVDASSLFSTEVYRRHFLDYDRLVIQAFPYSLVHTHSCGVHIIDALLTIEELRCIQINLDREAGAFDKDKIIGYAQKVQESGKCVVINGELTEDELDEFLSRLSLQGLAILYWNPTEIHNSSKAEPKRP